MEEFPCPKCSEVFFSTDDLHDHVLETHKHNALIEMRAMSTALKKGDFTQVDSEWIYVVGEFRLSLGPDEDGNFKLTVYGTVAPIPPATKYPTEPEWTEALKLANKFVDAYRIATGRE